MVKYLYIINQKRLQDFFSKIKDAKEGVNLKNQHSNINKEATDRMLKNLINSRISNSIDKGASSFNTIKRYPEKAVPLP